MIHKNYPKLLRIAAEQNLKEKDFWLKQLAGELVKAHFPYDYKKTSTYIDEAAEFDSTIFKFDEEIAAKLMVLSKGSNFTLNLLFIAGVILLLHKYIGNRDIIVGTPIYEQEMDGDFINTILVLRNRVGKNVSFREFILQVRQTLTDAIDNQNYPIELLTEKLKFDADTFEEGSPLFDVAVLLENIHNKKYLRHTPCSLTFIFRIEEADGSIPYIIGILEYNTALYKKTTLEKLVGHFNQLLREAIFNVDLPLSHLGMLTPQEKKQILLDFNNTETGYPSGKTIHQWFEEQVEKTPDKTAVFSPIDLSDIYNLLESIGTDVGVNKQMETCCFNKNLFIYHADLEQPFSKSGWKLLKTNWHNSVIVNKNMAELIVLFDGRRNLKTIYKQIKTMEDNEAAFLIYTMNKTDLLEVFFQFNNRPEIYTVDEFEDLVPLVQTLYRNHLIDLVGVNDDGMEARSSKSHSGSFEKEVVTELSIDWFWRKFKDEEITKAQVLLLGDTSGTPSTGLLYLGSYLMRKGIKTRCQFYDNSTDYASMKKNIETLLQQVQPEIVAISMKWFLYIARVIEMGTIIKEYARNNSLEIKIVVGGNTASYYPEKIMMYDCFDILVRGDGEDPLLRICRGEDIGSIPNCVYKNDGRIIVNPIGYVQDETVSREVYLSHLDEILLSHYTSRLGTFFIVTHKGCEMNCLYCGGCNRVHQKAFNRKKVFKRGVEEVRKDIMEAKPYTSTFMFEFDILDKRLVEYCRQIWEGIDLSGHFCIFSTLTPPSAQLIKLVSQTFKYVYWDFDICTPSETHRKLLFSMGLVKPQPTDEDIMQFMDRCDEYPNIEVRLNLITGLPCFTQEDIEPSKQLLSKIINNHSCFGELHWARLHAQPGAPILEDAGKYQMYAYASNFEEFLTYSQKSFNNNSNYLTTEELNYPYIYFKDDRMNSMITSFYLEMNKKVDQYKKDIRRGLIVNQVLTYRQLHEKANQLSMELKLKGVTPNQVVGIMLERSVDIPVGILGIMKAGCAFMPIDPEFPSGRIEYMLKDSNAKTLVATPETIAKLKAGIEKVSFGIIDISNLSSLSISTFGLTALADNDAYVIYTSGTTGKPKGTILSHRSVVNYVHWFTKTTSLTPCDKAILTSSFAFDLGYTTLFPSILNGGQLHILSREMYLLPDGLLDYILQKEITYLKVTPSLFSAIINAPGFSLLKCRTLRLAVIGGEPINVKDLEKAHALCPHLHIMNHYGPTEATIGCISTFVDFENFEKYQQQPVIGKPIYNANIYVLGKDLNLLPISVPGELCISGTCLARGYLNQPELTIDKFVFPSLHSTITSSLHYPAYRTGDLACWLSNGTIAFLGRIDKQVKIRGYRIELGEIENRLRKHPIVDDALVIVKAAAMLGVKPGDEQGEKYICAYIVSKANEGISPPRVDRKEKMENQKKVITFRELGIKKHYIEQAGMNRKKIAVKSNKRSLTFETLDQYANRLACLILEKYDDRYKLSKQERIRYIRQMLLAGWGQASQEKLKSTTVFVAGAGGGASPTVTQLALAGFGTIKICDFDTVELSNLNRQFLHNDERLGMNKAISAQITVGKTNPHVKVVPCTQKLTRENVFELVGDSAIIFDMFDGPADKFILSECAIVKQIPHLIISMTDINAYAAVLHSPHTPCYHCLFDKAKLETIVNAMKHYVANYSKNPLPVVSTSLFISTGVVVNEALKILLGFEEPAYNKFFYFNQRGAATDLAFTPGYKAMTHLFSDHFIRLCKEQGFDWEIGWRGNFLEELKIEPDPDCPVCGSRGMEMRKALEEQREKAHSVTYIQEEKREEEKLETIALLVNQDTHLAIGAVGAMKSGKVYVHLDTSSSLEELTNILEDSESRIIVTNDDWVDTAEKLRNRVNMNIAIINITHIEEMEKEDDTPNMIEIPTEIRPDRPAYMIYSPGSSGNLERKDISMKQFYEALFNGVEYTFEVNNRMPDTGSLSKELREYLREELPDYMIPMYFISLERLPLTPNGKVDIKALPEPGLETRKELVAPRNDVEETLMKIWSALLGKEKNTFGIDSNFFELGGHSLNATIMAARVNKELNMKLPVGEVFKTPTIRELSRYLMGSEEEIYTSIQPVEKKEYYPLSSAQMRMFLLSQIKTTTSDNIPGVYQVDGPLDYECLESTINRMIERHELLRTSFEMVDHHPVQRVHESVGLKITQIDANSEIHAISNQQIKDIINAFVQPFDLGKAPLQRVGLLKLAEENHLLIYDMHHIISDGTSFQLYIREFISLFAGMELPSIRIQYKDFSIWQNNLRESGVLKKQEEYWLNVFSGDIPTLNLSTDYPRQKVQSFEGDTIIFVLDKNLIADIYEIASKVGATLYMALLAIYNILLYKYTGQEDIVVGSSSAGRPHVDLEHVIGFFVNTLAMRNHPYGEITFLDFLKEVKTNALKAYENQDYQFDELVNLLGIQRDAGRQVLFDTHFTLHNIYVENSNVPKEGPGLGNLVFSLYPIEVKTTQFDIIIHANEISEVVHFTLRYCTKLFKRETIERFAKHYEEISRIVTENKNIKLKDIKVSHRLETAQVNMPEVNFNF
ncbi:MAG: hypothetical protein QG657_972 [Acidobacteriota bacterium]|nr:hypothetical protein [Acidobacteriota bacterium]